MAQKHKTYWLKNGQSYGVVLTLIVMVSILSWLIYPASSQTDRSFVFLRTTMPSAADEMNQQTAEQPLQEIPAVQPVAESVDPDQELVDMLLKDDAEIVYDTLEDKESWHVVRMRVTGYVHAPNVAASSLTARPLPIIKFDTAMFLSLPTNDIVLARK